MPVAEKPVDDEDRTGERDIVGGGRMGFFDVVRDRADVASRELLQRCTERNDVHVVCFGANYPAYEVFAADGDQNGRRVTQKPGFR